MPAQEIGEVVVKVTADTTQFKAVIEEAIELVKKLGETTKDVLNDIKTTRR